MFCTFIQRFVPCSRHSQHSVDLKPIHQPIKMLFLFFVASFILPSIMGDCTCLPEKYSGLQYISEQKSRSTLLVDYSQSKAMYTYAEGDLKFVLYADGKTYKQFADGSCSYESNPVPPTKCFGTVFKKIASTTLGGSFNVNTYGVVTKDSSIYLTVSDNCLPVIYIKNTEDTTETHILSNVTTTNVDVSPLNVDVSGCVASA